jgi:F-type H+-transporting ATPase subunit b
MLILASAAKPSLIDINFGLMFWTLVTFVIVLIVLKKYAFGPIQEAIDARRKVIESDLDAAQSAREEAQGALAEYRAALAESRKEAMQIVEQARRAAEEQRRRDIEALEAEKQRLMERAKTEIEAETRASLEAIKSGIAELTVVATEKVVRKRLGEDEQKRLIDEALADVDFDQFVVVKEHEPADG